MLPSPSHEQHFGQGKFKAKLALAAIVECVVGLKYLDLPAARFIKKGDSARKEE
jgi:hypothetical protein